jgi:hypothetical protein
MEREGGKERVKQHQGSNSRGKEFGGGPLLRISYARWIPVRWVITVLVLFHGLIRGLTFVD